MGQSRRLPGWVTTLLVVVLTPVAWAVAGVPGAVKATILKEAPGGKINGIRRSVVGKKPVYTADVILRGIQIEVAVANDGKLISKNVVADGKVKIDRLPSTAKATLQKSAKGAKVKLLERKTGVARTVYRADTVVGGRPVRLTVAADGTLVRRDILDDSDLQEGEGDNNDEDNGDQGEIEELVTIDQVPPAVLATILLEAPDGQVTEIERETTTATTVYEVKISLSGQEIELKVAEDGTLISKEVNGEDENEQGDTDEGDSDNNDEGDHGGVQGGQL